VKLLLDSHVLLWWLEANPRLAKEHRALLEHPSHIVYASSVSVAELQIKAALGKLGLPDDPLGVVIAEEGLEEIEFRSDHGDVLRSLPPIHRDPFDRMLIAQALVEDCVLVTSDPAIRQYAVPTV